MRTDDVRLSLLFALLMAVFCCTAGHARAEYADPGGSIVICSRATDGDYPEEYEETDRSVCEYDQSDDTEETADDLTAVEDAAAGAGLFPEAEYVVSPAAVMEYTATPGSFTEADAVYGSTGSAGTGGIRLMASDVQGEEEAGNNLCCDSAAADAVLAGPNKVVITLEVAAEGLKFYGFEIARKCVLSPGLTHLTDPDMKIIIPDEMSASKVPIVDTAAFGSVSIDETNIRRNRYRQRMLKISWTLEGAEEIARFAEGLEDEMLYVNLGGEYNVLDYTATDLCTNCGPVEVTGLAEAVRTASCPHSDLVYTPLNDEYHHIECGNCSCDFGTEAHVMEGSSCTDCGYSKLLEGTVVYRLNGRTLTETYSAPEGTKLDLRDIPGYLVPEYVTVPAGGGEIIAECEPVSYSIITESEEYTLLYDESLFLGGIPKKGYLFTGYVVEDVL